MLANAQRKLKTYLLMVVAVLPKLKMIQRSEVRGKPILTDGVKTERWKQKSKASL